MKRFLLIGVSVLAGNLYSLSWADDATEFQSPDGKFAMLMTSPEDGNSGYKVQLVEVSSHKLALELAASVAYPRVKDCKLLWSPDSQRFAFYEAVRWGGDTTVYFRNESGFTESPLPKLSDCATAAEKKELKAKGFYKSIEHDTVPKEWLKSGALVVVNVQGWETNAEHLRGCTQTVTIAFDAKHKASVQRVADKKSKSY